MAIIMKKIHLLIAAILVVSFTGLAQTNTLISKNPSNKFEKINQNNSAPNLQKLEITELNPPQNLVGNIINYNDLFLVWEPPGTYTNQWIQWDDGINNGNSVGATGGTFSVASHWTMEDLAPYHGMFLSKISFFPKYDTNAVYNVCVWTGPNGINQIISQPVDSFLVEEWNEISLDTSILIDSSVELWFGYSVTHEPGLLPAGCDDGPAIVGKGDMACFNGSTWVSMAEQYGYNFNWNLAGFVETTNKGGLAKPMMKTSKNASSTSPNFDWDIFNNGISYKKFSPIVSKELLGYNVYKNSEIIGFTVDTTFLEGNLSLGNYEYYVTAVYDEGESVPSNIVWIVGPPPCNPPVNVVAQVGNLNSLEISWEPPLEGTPLGYKLYRDYVLIEYLTALTYYDPFPEPGTFEYSVTSVCNGGESLPGCADSITILNLPPPTNFQAGIFEPLFIEMYWYPPENKNLLGYNLYCAHNDTIFDSVNFFLDNYGYYIAEELGWFSFYVTALYDEGESQPSNTEIVLVDGIIEKFINKLSIFPNPTSEGISIKSDFIIKSIDLYNSFGQLITNYKVNDKTHHLNTSEFNQGIYYLKIKFRDGLVTKKIVIE
jgi:hypothetical protein